MPLNVVYVDDEPELCDMFCEIFSNKMVNVKTFTDSKSAAEYLLSNKPDLLFLDYRMPTLNGDQLALLLDPNIPKVLVTGDLATNTEAKFVKVFSKPYDIDVIEKFILSYIKPQKVA